MSGRRLLLLAVCLFAGCAETRPGGLQHMYVREEHACLDGSYSWHCAPLRSPQ